MPRKAVKIAEQCQVGDASVSRLLRRACEHGDLHLDPPGAGYPPWILQEQCETLRTLVAKRSEVMIADLCDQWLRLFMVSVNAWSTRRTFRFAGLKRDFAQKECLRAEI